MSECYNLVCPETKKAIWVGQDTAGRRGVPYLYSTPERIAALTAWLNEHEGKAIFYVSDNTSLADSIDEENFSGFDDVDRQQLQTTEIKSVTSSGEAGDAFEVECPECHATVRIGDFSEGKCRCPRLWTVVVKAVGEKL